MNNAFKFHLPLEVLEKSTDPQGREVMKIGGIASTSEQDADGEFLDPNGFDLSYFKNQGFFNWHHMSKKDPMAIIGEPTKAEKRKEGLYVEGFLYSDSPIGKSVYSTAKMLEASSSNRRLGFSIEGRATKRKSEDEKHPDFKYVEKAAITGCAITFMPKNPKTFMDIVKGGIDEDYKEEEIDDEEVEKMLTAGNITGADTTDKTDASGAALKLESVGETKDTTTAEDEVSYSQNGGKTEFLTKSHVVNHIFDKYSGISLLTADKICNYIIKSLDMKTEELNINENDVEKAISDLESQAALSKASEEADDGYDEGDEEEESIKKAGTMCGNLKASGSSKSDIMSKMIEKGYPKEMVKSVTSGMFEANKGDKPSGENTLQKGLEDVIAIINDKNYSVGVILKGIYDGLNNMDARLGSLEKGIADGDLVKGLSNELGEGETEGKSDISKALEIFGGITEKLENLEKGFQDKIEGLEKALDAPNERKSITSKAVARQFQENDGQLEKAQGDGGENQISIEDKVKVLSVLDKAAFEKGFDADFGDALMKFENGNGLSPEIRKRLSAEKGVLIV